MAFLIFVSIGCNARFSSSRLEGNSSQGPTPNPGPNPNPNPKPEEPWQGGFLKVGCDFKHGRDIRSLGQAGMIDKAGTDFQGTSWEMIQFAEEGWIWVEIKFPGHDATQIPVSKPKTVSVEYYIFFRPDPWHNREFFEIRRTVTGEFQADQDLVVRWPVTKSYLKCKIEKPQQ